MSIAVPKIAIPWNLVTAAGLIFLTFMIFVQFPTAAATCSNSQNDANASYQPSSNSAGTFAYEDIPFMPTLCGNTWSNGGEIHGSVAQLMSTMCGIAYQWIEAGIFYGNASATGPSSGSHLAYFYNVYDSCSSGPAFNDASSGGTHPSAGDNVSVNIVVAPTGNQYDVSYDDITTGVTLSVNNVATPARTGPLNEAELETWDTTNVVVVYWGTLEYVTGPPGYTITHFPNSPSTSTSSTSSNYGWTQPNSYYDDWCAYYTGYSSYC
jgi:hypothetical protein